MEIYVVIDLQDHKGDSHRKKPFLFNSQTSIEEIIHAIGSDFNIDKKYIEIFHNGDQILSMTSTLESFNLKNDDEFIIKHSSLKAWTVFLHASDIPHKTPHAAKKRQVLEASHILQRLYTEGFFTTYAEFAIRRINFNRAFTEFIDDHDGFIRMAIERYFTALMEKNPENPTLSFNYSEKSVIGIQVRDKD